MQILNYFMLFHQHNHCITDSRDASRTSKRDGGALVHADEVEEMGIGAAELIKEKKERESLTKIGNKSSGKQSRK